MKTSLVLLFVVGVAMVSANPLSEEEYEEEYEEKLETAIKSLLQGEEELKLASRDTRGGCMRATNNCNGHGECVQGSWGGYYCRCTMPYRVGGTESSCYSDEELNMASRDILGGCMRATNNCNGHGECVQGSWGGYYCRCTMPYRVGGTESSCVAPATRESEKEENSSNLKMEILKRLVDLILKK